MTVAARCIRRGRCRPDAGKTARGPDVTSPEESRLSPRASGISKREEAWSR